MLCTEVKMITLKIDIDIDVERTGLSFEISRARTARGRRSSIFHKRINNIDTEA